MPAPTGSARHLAMRRLRAAGLTREDADDAAQELLVRLRDREATGALLGTLARFEARTVRRANGRRARRDVPHGDTPQAPSVDPAERARLAARLERLRASLGVLDRALLDDLVSGGGGTTRSCSTPCGRAGRRSRSARSGRAARACASGWRRCWTSPSELFCVPP